MEVNLDTAPVKAGDGNVKRHAVVVTHPGIRERGTILAEALGQLRRSGFEVSIIDNTEAPRFGEQTAKVDDDTEIVVVLGGDGTILRAAELVYCTPAPILGVNLGHVGFLAEFESFQMSEAIGRVASHDYSIDERMIAHADIWLPGAREPMSDWALNDITLETAERGKMIELGIQVDDVAIVSTPTGSTAYAFSVGGPVIWPNVKALQLVPIAAHALFSRPLIIGSGSRFTIDILDDSVSAGWICCDGRRSRELPKGTRVEIRESKDTLKLARLSGVPFANRLVSKFNLPVVGWREQGNDKSHNKNRGIGRNEKRVQGRQQGSGREDGREAWHDNAHRADDRQTGVRQGDDRQIYVRQDGETMREQSLQTHDRQQYKQGQEISKSAPSVESIASISEHLYEQHGQESHSHESRGKEQSNTIRGLTTTHGSDGTSNRNTTHKPNETNATYDNGAKKGFR
jgi:NAD+ kinase